MKVSVKEEWIKLNNIFNEIELKYDMLNDCYWGLKELFEMGNITDFTDIEYYLDDYITEEDEMFYGPITINKMIEDRDFCYRLFKEYIK